MIQQKFLKKKILINLLFIFPLIFIFRYTMFPNSSLLTMPNRTTDINDVILNTLGTYIGFRLFSKFKLAYNL